MMPEWGDGGLNRPSPIRGDKVYTLNQSLIVKSFGRVSPQTMAQIQQVLIDVTSQPLH